MPDIDTGAFLAQRQAALEGLIREVAGVGDEPVTPELAAQVASRFVLVEEDLGRAVWICERSGSRVLVGVRFTVVAGPAELTFRATPVLPEAEDRARIRAVLDRQASSEADQRIRDVLLRELHGTTVH